MKTVWKYPLAESGRQHIQIPKEGKILTVQVQHDKPYLWIEVDTTKQTEARIFQTFGTGHPLPEYPGHYLGTFQIYNGTLVFHVYETWRHK